MDAIAAIIIIFAVMLGFFINTIAGFAAGLTILPILLSVLSLQDAVSLLAVLYAISGAILLVENWKEAKWKLVIQLGIGIMIGMAAGIWVLTVGNPEILKVVLGAFILVYVVYHLTKHKKIPGVKRYAVLFGIVGGFFSGLFGAGGAPTVIFVENALKKAMEVRATIIAALATGNLVRIPMLIQNGLLDQFVWELSLLVLPGFLLVLFTADKIAHKIPEKAFHRTILILLTVAGVNLLFS